MKLNRIFDSYLGEACYVGTHENGLTVKVVEKPVKNACCYLFTNYGSFNTSFLKNRKPCTSPAGVAHFLEHKVFACPDGSDGLDLLTDCGMDSNAYTCGDITTYLFSGSGNVKKALKTLLYFVFTPYFTKENVEKEQGIIREEILMHRDNPWERVTENMLKNMYQSHPIRVDTLGSVESIAQITPEVLTECYNAFYRPDNMTLLFCGGEKAEKIADILDEFFSDKTFSQDKIEKIYPEEPTPVGKDFVFEKAQLPASNFSLGFKLPLNAEALSSKTNIGFTYLNQLLFSPSSDLRNRLTEKKLVQPGFSATLTLEGNLAMEIIGGTSRDPLAVKEEILSEIGKAKKYGLSETDFRRAKKMLIAEEVRCYETAEDIIGQMLNESLSGLSPFENLRLLREFTLADAEEVLAKWDENNYTLSIIGEKQ